MADPYKTLSDAMSGKPKPPPPKPDPKTVVTGKVAGPSIERSKDPAVQKAIAEAIARQNAAAAKAKTTKPKR